MTLFKLHPDFDLVLKEILELDPQGQILLFKHKDFHHQLMSRFQAQMPESLWARIHFLPWQSRLDLLRVIYHSELILDPLHFGGGNTCYLTFAVGTPMLTCPTEFMRSRGTYALYQVMGMHDEVVVASASEYAQQAFKIASSPTLRQALTRQILEQNHLLFGSLEHNQALIHFCNTLLRP